jgi:hypothetical protein
MDAAAPDPQVDAGQDVQIAERLTQTINRDGRFVSHVSAPFSKTCTLYEIAGTPYIRRTDTRHDVQGTQPAN